MRKKIMLALVFATTVSHTQAVGNNPHHDAYPHSCRFVDADYHYANAVGEAASGILHALRINAMDGEDPEKIRNLALLAFVASGFSAACKIATCFANGLEFFDVGLFKHIAEGFNAFRMYQKAKSIAQNNKTLSQQQKEDIIKAKRLMRALLATTRPFDIWCECNIALETRFINNDLSNFPPRYDEHAGFQSSHNHEVLQRHGPKNNPLYFFITMLFPIYEYYYNNNLKSKPPL